MACQGLVMRAFNFVANCRIFPNNRNPLFIPVMGVKQRFVDRIKELKIPEKPKRPLTPYFKFVQDHRASVLKANPNLKVTEVTQKCAADWRTVDPTVKEEYETTYKAEIEEYRARTAEYNEKLTDEQQEALEDFKLQVKKTKERRKRKQLQREFNKPKRPLGPFMLWVTEQMLKEKKALKDVLPQGKEQWANLSDAEREKYTAVALNAKVQYEKVLKDWEWKMIQQGNVELVRKSTLAGKTRTAKKVNKRGELVRNSRVKTAKLQKKPQSETQPE